ncbi:MAG TPA: PDZ domain-containing protein [Planctomycetaceae bacterium]|nr:PDZ domain-containing protein [Planctomycetaceae bacterium]
MKRLCNLRAGLILCAVTTCVMGASQLVAQNQPATQNPSDRPTTVEQKSESAEQPSQQNGVRQPVGHPVGAPQQMGLGIQFEKQANSGHGLEIASVDPNSPAAQAGLQAHDRVISIDGRPFAHHRHAKAYLTAQTGRPVPLMIERNGRQLLLHFVPGNPEGDSGWLGILLYGENEMAPNAQNVPAAQPNARDGNQDAQSTSGGSPSTLGSSPVVQSGTSNTPYAGQNAPGQRGARVAQIYPGSPAARAGLQPGDLVTQINGQKIDDPAELIALVHEMKPQAKADFEVTRDNQTQKIPVTIGSRTSDFAETQAAPGDGQAGPDANALQRIEDEMRQLRDEIRQLREQLQKK